jgi:hypothetical protein
MHPLESVKWLLTLQMKREDMLTFNRKHFFTGLIGTWMVGMGRYWDDPGANILQHLGLGSVIYIFVLAFFIWLIVKPFRVEHWNYFTVVTFISLTSFPAIFYAIPVERFFSIETANTINVWFLAIVAIWRLTMLFYFLKQYTQLHFGNILTITLMPICLIISALTALNLHRVVFNIMGGVRNPTPHDASYTVLLVLTGVSIILVGPLLFFYAVGIYYRAKSRRDQKA